MRSRLRYAITMALALSLILTTTLPVLASDDTDTCHLKRGPSGIPLGVAHYFHDVLGDTIRAIETLDAGVIELHSDWLCWAPRSAQPIMIATAEHILYLIFEIIPQMASL